MKQTNQKYPAGDAPHGGNTGSFLMSNLPACILVNRATTKTGGWGEGVEGGEDK